MWFFMLIHFGLLVQVWQENYGQTCNISFHETSVKPKWLKRFLFRILDKSASDIIYVSKYLKQKDPVKQTKQHVIYNALTPEFVGK
jgi:hypothetical protein